MVNALVWHLCGPGSNPGQGTGRVGVDRPGSVVFSGSPVSFITFDHNNANHLHSRTRI